MARFMQPVMQRYPETPPPSEPTERPVAPEVTPAPDVELPSHSRLPRLDLGVDWGSPWQDFRSSWHDFFRGPRAPENSELPADSDLRVEWIEGKVPGRAFTASALWHAAAVGLLLLPIWHFLASDPPNLAPVRIELTWTNPTQDLPPISLPGHEPKPSPMGDPAKPLPQKGADAFHPRQTILSQPAAVTHPRQTLIQPDAPPAPPKIEVPLPNIVEWAAPSDAREAAECSVASTAAAPQMQASRRERSRRARSGESGKNSRAAEHRRFAHDEFRSRACRWNRCRTRSPRRARRRTEAGAAPEIGAAASAGDDSLHRVIALSASPAPPAPEVSVPQGNLAARIAISPEGNSPAFPAALKMARQEMAARVADNSSGGGRGTNRKFRLRFSSRSS